MKFRYASLALVLALMAAFVIAPFSGVSAATKDKSFLKNIPVTGTLADGGTFNGKVSITEFGYDQATGLWVSGRIIGTATNAAGTTFENISQSFSTADATLNETSAANSIMPQAACQILFLDIGPIFLDLLGLQVDLSRIVLDISAVSGAG